ncbi:MAG: regulatory protein TetR [Rhodoglobus sp.]|nr:regulatory protein TetR [Rhodoglobus sp.]
MTLQVEGTRTEQILDVAQRLVQTRGFNDFSYADIAEDLAITKAALHYHYRSKAALGDALIARYAERFLRELQVIEATETKARARLEAYVGLYRSVLAAGRMCLCGMLAAEYLTLPDPMRVAVEQFFDRNEAWLERVLGEGLAARELFAAEPVRDSARMIIDTLEGAMMIARARDDIDRFDRVASRLLASFDA